MEDKGGKGKLTVVSPSEEGEVLMGSCAEFPSLLWKHLEGELIG